MEKIKIIHLLDKGVYGKVKRQHSCKVKCQRFSNK